MTTSRKPPISLRCLVVENDGFLAVELADALTEFGHTVVGTATTVDGALNLAEEHEIDLALVDLALNQKGFGGDVAELLLRRHGVPSLILSGHLTPMNREAVESLGLFGIMRKPFDRMALRAQLGRRVEQMKGTSA